MSTSGIGGQFGVELLVGAAWTPCIGSTLSAASVMAARGENLGMVSLTTFAFGIAAALPLLLLGLMSREALLRWRGYIARSAGIVKIVLGVLLILAGTIGLTGADRTLETALESVVPKLFACR